MAKCYIWCIKLHVYTDTRNTTKSPYIYIYGQYFYFPVTFVGRPLRIAPNFGMLYSIKKWVSTKLFSPPRPPFVCGAHLKVQNNPFFLRFLPIFKCSLLEAELIFFNSATATILVFWSCFFQKSKGNPILQPLFFPLI